MKIEKLPQCTETCAPFFYKGDAKIPLRCGSFLFRKRQSLFCFLGLNAALWITVRQAVSVFDCRSV